VAQSCIAALLPHPPNTQPVDPLVPLLKQAAKCIAARSRQWTVKTIGQLLGDKSVLDAAADASSAPRVPFSYFFVDWHLQR